MPYIEQTDRFKYSGILMNLPNIKTKGDLEYCVYYLMLKFMNDKEERYSNLTYFNFLYSNIQNSNQGNN